MSDEHAVIPFTRDQVTGAPRPKMAPVSDATHSHKVHGVVIGLFYAPNRPIWPTRELAMLTLAHPINMRKGFIPALYPEQNDPGIATVRNNVCKQAIKDGFKYLLMLDDDVAPIPELVTNLVYELEQNPEVGGISAVYCTKEEPPAPVFSTGDGDGPCWEWTLGDIITGAGGRRSDPKSAYIGDGKGVRYIGAGALMLRCSALERVPEPWFKMEMGGAGAKVGAISEDFYFTRNCQEAGVPLWVHGGILLAHLDNKGKPFILRQDSRPMRGVPIAELKQYMGVPVNAGGK